MMGALKCLAAAVSLAACLPACAPVRVHSYEVPATDMRTYQTYAWDAAELGATGDPRLDNNTFFRERVQQAADAQMGFRGYTKVRGGTPEMVLHIHARVEQQVDSSQVDPETHRCDQDECRTFVYDQGTLLIDIIDARTKALIWRGWAERSLDGVVDNQEVMNQAIDRAVSSIFAKLPVRRLTAGRPS